MPEETPAVESTTLLPTETVVAETQEFQPWKGFADDKGSLSQGWTEKLTEDPTERESFKSLERYKTLPEMAKGFKELEKTLGKKANAVVIPTDKSTPEELAAYRKAVGVPETPDKYNIKPETLPDGIEWNDENVKPYMDIAHKHNIPEAAMRDLVAAQLSQEQLRVSVMGDMDKKTLEENKAVLRKDWGQDYDKNLELAGKAATLAGVDPASPGFTDPNVVKAFSRLAGMLSEDKFVSSDGSPVGGQSPLARAKDIATNPDNPLFKKYQAHEPDTVAYVQNLYAQATKVK